MNNTNENKTSDIYLAHVDFETGRTQSFQEHTDNVTSYAKSICPMGEIQKLVEAAALFHDAGKLSDDVQKDFQDILKREIRHTETIWITQPQVDGCYGK